VPNSPETDPPVLDYSTALPAGRVPIARFGQEYEAHLAAGKLAVEGIEAQVAPTDLTGLDVYGHVARGAVLAVEQSDVTSAVAILNQTPARSKLLIHPALAVEPAMQCPRCGSSEVSSLGLIGWRLAVVALLGLSAPAMRATWQCGSCGHRWRGKHTA
jgi:hypothetical protein